MRTEEKEASAIEALFTRRGVAWKGRARELLPFLESLGPAGLTLLAALRRHLA
ncbi:MAG TPA: hypothetical protein GXX50_08645 [Firmicutes bacterium]|nr:hypothetical protein [Bacillota bacterium]